MVTDGSNINETVYPGVTAYANFNYHLKWMFELPELIFCLLQSSLYRL